MARVTDTRVTTILLLGCITTPPCACFTCYAPTPSPSRSALSTARLVPHRPLAPVLCSSGSGRGGQDRRGCSAVSDGVGKSCGQFYTDICKTTDMVLVILVIMFKWTRSSKIGFTNLLCWAHLAAVVPGYSR